MKYFLYVVLLYLFLPFSFNIDLITILVFFILFHEDERFTLIFSCFTGLLLDLYNPSSFGVNMLLYVVLVQILLYIKKYIAKTLPINLATFIIFYLVKIAIVHVVLSSPFEIQPITMTIIFFLPLFLVLNKMINGIWTKT